MWKHNHSLKTHTRREPELKLSEHCTFKLRRSATIFIVSPLVNNLSEFKLFANGLTALPYLMDSKGHHFSKIIADVSTLVQHPIAGPTETSLMLPERSNNLFVCFTFLSFL
ncbi:hypothetical protein AMECASPLE_009496 [Ameca splendens]|uniref:Uncharacterized protein n=1 Tax=Ameca splendens TaxID=208324 RepID=A0ABV1A7W5_9TELE